MKGKLRVEVGLQCYTTTEPIAIPPPLTPSRAFEEDIYKPLVWQRGEAWLFYLPDLSCVTVHEACCADRVTERGADGDAAALVQGRTLLPVGHGEGLMQQDCN